jgi:uroporphyrinogen-III synthase
LRREEKTTRVVVTRPKKDAERTAITLRHRGRDVLVAPLMGLEPVMADLTGQWSAVAITSANAPGTIADNPMRMALLKLPLFAVGDRSAEAAKEAGFANVYSAAGDVHDLIRILAEHLAAAADPLLYLAGEARAANLVGELSARGIAAEMRVVYRAVTTPFPPELARALVAGEIDNVLHFSKRSAENYLIGATAAGIVAQALAVRHVCLSEQTAKPLAAAGATRIAIAARPEETALIELLSILSD